VPKFTFRVKVRLFWTWTLEAEDEDKAIAMAQTFLVEDIQKDGLMEVADVDVKKYDLV